MSMMQQPLLISTLIEHAVLAHPDAGMPAASITDDTEQALLTARLIIEGHGHVEPAIFARELVA